MKIGLNAVSLTNRSGTGFYTRALVDHLSTNAVPGAEVHVWLPSAPQEYLLFRPSDLSFPDRVIPHFVSTGEHSSRFARVLWEQFRLPRECRDLGIDLLHSPTGVAPRRLPCRSVVTLHDVAFLVFPKDFTWKHRFFLGRTLPRSARAASLVLTDSEHSKREIHRRLGVPTESIKVIPLGLDERYFKTVPEEEIGRLRKTFSLPEAFALYVGTLEPRKNLEALVEALGMVREELRDFVLVIAGRKGWKTETLFDRVRELGLEKMIRFTGFVPEADLPTLYRAARLFVYPSKYEGFGLPPLEAMAARRPVLCSNASSLPEVVGDAALLTNPSSPRDMADALLRLWNDEDERRRLSEAAGEWAKGFSWEKTAFQTFEALRETAAGTRRRAGDAG